MQAVRYARAGSLDEAVRLLADGGDTARVLAGGTDVIVQARERRRDIRLFVDIKHVPETMALSSAAFAVLILIPCAALTVLGLARWQENPFVPLHPEGTTLLGSVGVGLSVALWFYSGYESV